MAPCAVASASCRKKGSGLIIVTGRHAGSKPRDLPSDEGVDLGDDRALGDDFGGWYRIASGAGAAVLIQQALLKGFFPVFAMPVDEEYISLSSARTYEGRRGPSLGGHMQAICGYGADHVKVVT